MEIGKIGGSSGMSPVSHNTNIQNGLTNVNQTQNINIDNSVNLNVFNGSFGKGGGGFGVFSMNSDTSIKDMVKLFKEIMEAILMQTLMEAIMSALETGSTGYESSGKPSTGEMTAIGQKDEEGKFSLAIIAKGEKMFGVEDADMVVIDQNGINGQSFGDILHGKEEEAGIQAMEGGAGGGGGDVASGGMKKGADSGGASGGAAAAGGGGGGGA